MPDFGPNEFHLNKYGMKRPTLMRGSIPQPIRAKRPSRHHDGYLRDMAETSANAEPFAEYVERCLYAPGRGFYTSGRGVAGGRKGDFITSPEVGPLFGAVLAEAINTWWRDAGEPERFPVIDLGTGPGGLLRALEMAAPACAGAWTLIGIDRTPNATALDASIDLSGAVVIANELLDNVPFDIGMRHGGVDHQLMVAGEPPGHTTSWQPVPNKLDLEVPEDTAFPVLGRAASLVEQLLEMGPRRVVAFDYGVATTAALAERAGWMRTYRQHQRGEDPFFEPGEWDITTDIAVDQLPTPDRIGTQAAFLETHGIDRLVEEGRAYWKALAATPNVAAMRMRSRIREAEALTDPSGLGGFLCLEWTPQA